MAPRPIIVSDTPVAILGGGQSDLAALEIALALAPTLVAADGGADIAIAQGVMPRAVIGDFDSLSSAAKKSLPNTLLHHVPEQQSTDFEKCLTRIDAPLILGVGFSGARLDHELAALNTLVRHPDRRCILIGPETVSFIAPPHLNLDLPVGSLCSLFPLAAVTGQSKGLRWPIDGINFAPSGRVGTSNETTGPLTLDLDAPGMLVLVARAALHHVCGQLINEPSRWA